MLYAFFNSKQELDKPSLLREIEILTKLGLQGISLLGLASEVHKMTGRDRIIFLEWVMEAVNGRLPVACTVAEPTVAAHIEFGKRAADLGASWLILQPARVRDVSENEHLRFFGAIADKVDLPIAIQVAPEYLGQGFSGANLKTLHQNHSNICLLKLEATPMEIERIIDATGGVFDVFNGQAGVWMPDAFRAGAVGFIPGSEICDRLATIYSALTSDEFKRNSVADDRYAELLPLISIFQQSIDNLVTYGKLFFAYRAGLSKGCADARQPASPPTAIGLKMLKRFESKIGVFK